MSLPICHAGQGKINGAAQDLGFPARHPHLSRMNYVLAMLLPPLSIVLTGRPFLGILLFPIWVLAVLFSGGLTHPMFVLLAWLLIFQSRERLDQRG